MFWNPDESRVLCGRNRLSYGEFRVSPVMTTSITLRVYFNPLLTQKFFGEKSRREHWKIFDFWFWKPLYIKDFRRTKRPSRRKISSAAPSTTRTTLRVCNSAFLPKTFGKNWRKEQQNIQFSNRRKPCIYGLFKRSKQPTLQKISSQPRYDRFDTFPYSAKAWKNTLCAYYFIGFERKSQAFFGKKVDIYRAMRLQ